MPKWYAPAAYNNYVGRIVHIPKYRPAVPIGRARGDHTRNAGAGHPHPVPPTVGGILIVTNARNGDKRYFQTVLESPEFVTTANMQCQIAFRHR
jgi:hypothetical protein